MVSTVYLFLGEDTSHGRGRIFGLLKISGRLSSSREKLPVVLILHETMRFRTIR